MKRDEAAEVLELLVEQAPKLRDAGVKSVALGDLHFELRPSETAYATDDDDSEDDDTGAAPPNPLYDRDTFGGRIPGEPRPASRR